MEIEETRSRLMAIMTRRPVCLIFVLDVSGNSASSSKFFQELSYLLTKVISSNDHNRESDKSKIA